MKKKRPGRPSTRPPDLVVFNAQLTERAKARLQALAQLEGRPAYAVLEEAFWLRWESLPAQRRKEAETIASTIERARETRAAG